LDIYVCWKCGRVLSDEEGDKRFTSFCCGKSMEKIEVLEIEAIAFNEESFR